MEISVHNLTTENILITPTDSLEAKGTLVPATSQSRLTLAQRPRRQAGLVLRGESEESEDFVELKASKLKLRGRKTWALVSDERGDRAAWRIYLCRANAKKRNLVIIKKRDMSCFLNTMEDGRSLSDLCLPGTHDTLAFYGWPVSQCQSMSAPLSVQLNSGIRVIDVRMAVVNGRLIAYHGIVPELTSFQAVLATVHAFLTAPVSCRETVVMSIKQEDFASTPPADFSRLVHTEIYSGQGGREMWFLENRVPHLGEARGKVIMLSRFGGDGAGWENGLEGLGIHPTIWPDSAREGFEWRCKNTLVRTHDWYGIPSFLSIPEKVELATANLLAHRSDGPTTPILNISYLSAGSVPLALPPTVACGFGWPEWHFGVEGVNSRAGKWLLDQLSSSNGSGTKKPEAVADAPPTVRGWAFMDFFDSPENLAPLFVECNY